MMRRAMIAALRHRAALTRAAGACTAARSPLSRTRSHYRALTTHVGPPLRKKMTIVDVAKLYHARTPISMVTAYSYPSAVHVNDAGVDILLVGDSLGMVELGYDTTVPVTLAHMSHHCQAVTRGALYPLLVADLPFGSYEMSATQAFESASRLMKEANIDAVKLEGGVSVAPIIAKLVDSGVAVMGHIGLTPQKISTLGGFRAQGKTFESALSLVDDALALQQAGCFAIVIECVPDIVARLITDTLSIPTIGIGSGQYCSGQVLVFHDLLGYFQHAHHAKVSPRFSKIYARIGDEIQRGLEQYNREVKSREFPGTQYAPYKMTGGEEKLFQEKIQREVDKIKHKYLTTTSSSGGGDGDGGGDSETIKVY